MCSLPLTFHNTWMLTSSLSVMNSRGGGFSCRNLRTRYYR